MRILIVEDQRKMANFIQRGLKEEKYAVDVAHDAEKALYSADINEYDLIVLDVMLPGKDGFFVCRELRKNGNKTPILMLTSRDATEDKVTGLDLGADDYLTKPFIFEEFLARVRALLRRKNDSKTTILKYDDLELDQVTHKVKRAGKDISLSTKEYALLEYFVLRPEQVITRTMISEHVWNESFDSFTNVIDVYVRYLRNKMDRTFQRQLIHTLRGTGYMLSKTPPS